jgi:hypothetical protein
MKFAPLAAGALVALLSTGHMYGQSLSYTKGQPVHPAFEGWEKNDDGSFSLLFGYMNDNWEQVIDVPVGPDNSFDLGGADRGQPTHFLPRRNRFVFKVRVPADFGTKELTWTLKTNGVTEKAYASLKPDYFVDNVVIASETGALGPGASNPTLRANKPPVVKLDGPSTVTARVGQPVQIAAIVTDDGVPKTRSLAPDYKPDTALALKRAMMPLHQVRLTVNKVLGLHMTWFVYRGAGTVTFDPVQVKSWEDTRPAANSPWAALWLPPAVPPGGRYQAQVTFDQPGTYVLRARADDGALLDDEELTVTVTP